MPTHSSLKDRQGQGLDDDPISLLLGYFEETKERNRI